LYFVAFSSVTLEAGFNGENHLQDCSDRLLNISDSECGDLDTEWSSEEELVGGGVPNSVGHPDIHRERIVRRYIRTVHEEDEDGDSCTIGRDKVSQGADDEDILDMSMEAKVLDIEPKVKQSSRKALGDNAPGVDVKIEMLPRVMIVGRPNVGKSALFNR
jgi:polynucleotide 5'-kinase involved in rRNA processing